MNFESPSTDSDQGRKRVFVSQEKAAKFRKNIGAEKPSSGRQPENVVMLSKKESADVKTKLQELRKSVQHMEEKPVELSKTYIEELGKDSQNEKSQKEEKSFWKSLKFWGKN